MRLSVVGLDRKGPLDQVYSNVVLSYLMGDNTKQVQGDRLIGVSQQSLLVWFDLVF